MPAPFVPTDPLQAAVRAAAHASLVALRDDLVAARGAAAAATEATPSTTLDWFGPASQALRDALDRLALAIDVVHADLDRAVPLVDQVLA
ncbi:hypothetical protein [Agrococcus sp. SGAir0287]|uniref:hypothetical protein n=1 Tax=Agrococcus sp. SGAir0287 TaxID=2070347 RepID=UPI0010F7B4AD|nr:hypothetical protein [Agrococcus sp. SGAir0287]